MKMSDYNESSDAVLDAIFRRFTDGHDETSVRFVFRTLNLVHEARLPSPHSFKKLKTEHALADEAAALVSGSMWRQTIGSAKDLTIFAIALRAMMADSFVNDCVSRVYWHARRQNQEFNRDKETYIDMHAEGRYKRLHNFTTQFPIIFTVLTELLDAIWNVVFKDAPADGVRDALVRIPCEPGHLTEEARRAQRMREKAPLIARDDEF